LPSLALRWAPGELALGPGALRREPPAATPKWLGVARGVAWIRSGLRANRSREPSTMRCRSAPPSRSETRAAQLQGLTKRIEHPFEDLPGPASKGRRRLRNVPTGWVLAVVA